MVKSSVHDVARLHTTSLHSHCRNPLPNSTEFDGVEGNENCHRVLQFIRKYEVTLPIWPTGCEPGATPQRIVGYRTRSPVPGFSNIYGRSPNLRLLRSEVRIRLS